MFCMCSKCSYVQGNIFLVMCVMMAPFKNPKIIKNANITNANGQFVSALSADFLLLNNVLMFMKNSLFICFFQKCK